jgi:hypothetical protein
MMKCSMSAQVIRLIMPNQTTNRQKIYLLITFMPQHTIQRHGEVIIKYYGNHMHKTGYTICIKYGQSQGQDQNINPKYCGGKPNESPTYRLTLSTKKKSSISLPEQEL